MSSSCHGSQAALLAAPTPHGKYTSLTDRGSGVTGPHNRPAWASWRPEGEGGVGWGGIMHSRLRAPLHFHHGEPCFFVSKNKSSPPVSSTPVPV